MIRVNGIEFRDYDPDTKLSAWLREELDLTGTKVGCDIGVCGSCTVLVNGEPKRSCKLKLQDVEGAEILTIEGVASPDGSLHPIQQAFIDAGAIQCGFCTPGMVLASHALLAKNPHPSRVEVRQALKGNLCRCTGYQQIIDAVLRAAEVMSQNP
ncbi:MAG: (2Fe-2S)-binding protein [Candidatus Cloacimonetes bacterium]|nr:(2Fe-2S)-binding protein [Candidatus Cloacimonadota bacterium]